MCNTIELCGGAFVSTFEKGENGKPGKWINKANPNYKKPKKKETGIEKPQYPIIVEIESSASKRYQSTLKSEMIEIVKFLKSVR